MTQIKPSASDILLYRTLFIIGGSAFILFWFIIKIINPEGFDPLWGRVLLSLVVFISLFLTYKSDFFYTNIVQVAYVLSYVLVIYYMFLLIMNHYSNTYCTGLMVVIFGGAMVFKGNISLMFFLITCLISVGAGYFSKAPEPVFPSRQKRRSRKQSVPFRP